MWNVFTQSAIAFMERGWVPDTAIRAGIRLLLRRRLRALETDGSDRTAQEVSDDFLQRAAAGELALATDKANEQHYELPVEFFRWVLGPRKKYSCCYFERPGDDLATAEVRSLELTCAHAELADGMEILELGCGWGSLSLWMLEQFPHARVVALSNSHSQRHCIEQQAQRLGVADRLEVVTGDIRDYQSTRRFDRVVSVEMFEHVRNHRVLLERIARWLQPTGRLFVHVFCHRRFAYPFDTEGPANWMGRNFFTGGIMPHHNWLRRFDTHLQQVHTWVWNGEHYARTCRLWIDNMHHHRDRLVPLLDNVYGIGAGRIWFQRWKIFFLACAELFAYRGGDEWFVGHYLLKPVLSPDSPSTAPFPGPSGSMTGSPQI